MPRLKWSSSALRDVGPLHDFLAPKSKEAARLAGGAIRESIKLLSTHPEIGRPLEETPEGFREWVIEFEQSAYIAIYHYDGKEVVILAMRHGREAGY